MKKSVLAAAFLIVVAQLDPGDILLLQVIASDDPELAGNGAIPRQAPPFDVPSGFVVEQVAGPPLVERPMMASFDDRGRLFVCDSSGFNLLQGSSDILVKDPPHAIRMLEDIDGDGRFDKSTLFADKMTFPMGALWYEGSLYTASAPSLWRLTDTDNDGVADRREEFVTKFDFGGNACDIHGPFLGPDGWIYWANCQRGFEIREPSGKVLKGKAAGLFRVRPDGNDVELVCAGGMDNPVEVAFSDEGEAFATVNIFNGAPEPRNDAIIHCIEGGLFPYRELAKQFKRTGDRLPAMINLGWVAPAGLARYRSQALGADYSDNLFSAHFDRHCVQRHVIERDGATFRGQSEDFVASADPDFHPTDVLEDADGSLLLIDTGGWFLRGCPTSQIAKPEITGAIYRIRRASASAASDPRGLKLDWSMLSPEQLAVLLDDPRWVVRDRTIHELGKRGGSSIGMLSKVLRSRETARARVNAVWALTRVAAPEARAAIVGALADREATVRIAACNSLGLNRAQEGLATLMKLAVADDLPAVRRQAATALGRLRNRAAVPALLEAARSGQDRFLEHAQIYALIEIADTAQTLKALQDPSPSVRRAGLIALDQMDDGPLTRDLVLPQLDTADADLHHAALTIIMSRPEWADAVAGLMRQWLADSDDLEASRRDLLHTAILSFCKDAEVQKVIAAAMHEDTTSVAVRLLLLEAMNRSPLDRLPDSWLSELGRSLAHPDDQVVRLAVATLRARAVTAFDPRLMELAEDDHQPDELRVLALAAASPRLASIGADQFDYLRGQLDGERPPLIRLAAADALSNVRLDDNQLKSLADALTSLGAMELPRLITAFGKSSNPAVGNSLIAALAKSPGLESLTAESLRATLKDYPQEVQLAADPLLKQLGVDMERQLARLAELEPVMLGGSVPQGRAVFFGTRAACASCHTIQSIGGKVGPDLSKIGGIRTPRDLLESIIVPSASFVRTYEPYVVSTTDGAVYTGFLSQETADAIRLVAADRTERSILQSMIDEIAPSRVSIMPQGLDAQLSRKELSDLIAFLSSLK